MDTTRRQFLGHSGLLMGMMVFPPLFSKPVPQVPIWTHEYVIHHKFRGRKYLKKLLKSGNFMPRVGV